MVSCSGSPGRLPLCWCQCCQPAALLHLLLLLLLRLRLRLLLLLLLLLPLPWLLLLLLLLLSPTLLLLPPPAAPAAAAAAAASSVAAAATPHERVRACPAVCTVAAPLLQRMRAGRAHQGLKGVLLGGGCGRDKG